MLKRIMTIGLGVSTLLLGATDSWSATRKFVGGGSITAVNTACESEGWGVGQTFSMTFVPQNMGGARTSLSFFYQYGAMNFTLASGSAVGTTYRAVTGREIFRDFVTMSGVSMRLRTLTPANPLTATSVYMVGDIVGFDVPGCTISFKASGAAYP